MRLSLDLRIKYKQPLLIINNHLRNRRSLISLLGNTYNIVVASNVKEGRYIMEASKDAVCAVLLNPSESQESAISFIRHIRDRASLSPLPVLLLAEDPMITGQLNELFEEGAVDCIRPPYDNTIIQNRLENAMKLRDSMTFYGIEKMLKELPSNILLKDREGRFVFSSHDMRNLAHSDDPNWTIRGKTDADVRDDKENIQAAIEADREIVATGQGTSYTIKVPYQGTSCYFEIIKRPVFADDGSVNGIVGLVNNVTEQELLKMDLQRRVRTDEMTGLYNRAYFYEYLKDLPNKDFYPVSIVSADCDGLKTINDTYGHMAGDEYLKISVSIFQTVLPEKSVLFRVGGDEFVFILPSTSEAEAAALVDQMNLRAQALQIKDHPVSVSYGIATMQSPKDIAEEYLAISDEKMYEAKRQRHA